MQTKTRSKQPFCLSEGPVGDPGPLTMIRFQFLFLHVSHRTQNKKMAGVSLKNVKPSNVKLESTHHKAYH